MRNPNGAARLLLLRGALLGLVTLAAGCAGVGGGADPGSRAERPDAPALARAPADGPAARAPAAADPRTATPAPAPAGIAEAAPAPAGPAPAAPAAAVAAPNAVPARPADAHRDIWQRLRAGFAMPDLPTPLVQEKERFYLSQPEALNRMFARGGRYLHFIVEEVEKRGMPTELALLPFVESAMNPVALSPAAAAGLWQFIPATGRRFELSQNWWVDNRRDVAQSTRAALEYLQIIHDMHGNDWFLALASYNWGENAVARAVKNNRARGLPTDYLSLSMPNETRHYVPKLIALKNIVMRADQLGLALPEVPNRPYFATIEKTRPIDLKLAAQFAGMSVEEFVALNPAHNRPVIAASRNNQIRLPADRVDAFHRAMARHEAQDKPLASWQPYTLQPGETIEDVARRGNVTAAELLKANGLSAKRRILPGTQVLAPQATVKDEMKVESFEGPKVYEQVTTPPVYHRVGRRESLAAIASSYGVRVEQLQAWNGGVKAPKPGASLLVRPGSTATMLTHADGSRQMIARGEPPKPSFARREDDPPAPAAAPPALAAATAPSGARSGAARTPSGASRQPALASARPTTRSTKKPAAARSAPSAVARAAPGNGSVRAVYTPPRAPASKSPAPKRPRT
jgi:membrane-bound lytic murein transglycosylase D